LSLVAPKRLPDRRARPPRPDAGGRVSGLPRRAMGYRRDADLCPRRGRSRPAPAGGVTTEWPAVRVDARGGGRGHRADLPLRNLCLTQRRELRGRVNGLAHQLAQRALLRAAGGRRGEHVFGRLRTASDGTRTLRGSVRQMPRIWLSAAQFGARNLQSILQIGLAARPCRRVGNCGRWGPQGRAFASRETARATCATNYREPSEDQTSTLVRTLSTTASVNADVDESPPRSTVFTPPATVSSTPS